MHLTQTFSAPKELVLLSVPFYKFVFMPITYIEIKM